jgi:hypothetical protein
VSDGSPIVKLRCDSCGGVDVTGTLLKLRAKLDSKNALVDLSSGCPDEFKTSCTMGGASKDSGLSDSRCMTPFLHSSHLSPATV